MQSRPVRTVITRAMERASRTGIRHIPEKGYAICYTSASSRGKRSTTTIFLPYYDEYEQAEAALQRRIKARLV